LKKAVKRISEKRGSSLLEVAIVLPFLLFAGFVGLDLSKAMSIHQQLSMIAREGGNLASRECITLNAACLTVVTSQIDSLLPGAEVMLSVYQESGGTVSLTAINPASGATLDGNVSHYDATRVASEVTALNALNQRIVITEVFYSYDTVLPFNYFDQRVFYESTIY